MNRSQRIHNDMYLLQEMPTPEPQPVSAPTLTPIPIVHLTNSRKRKRCEFEITPCVASHQYMIYSSPAINVA